MRKSAVLVVLFAAGCAPEYEVTGYVGGDGELRFNLQFTNEANVDLDLHVITPADEEIYYATDTDSTGGRLDVDCYCSNCDLGPNENIFWEYGAGAAPGDYEVFVQYFGSCSDGYYDYYDYYDADSEPSEYTLRLMQSGEVLETFTGTLTTPGEQASYTHTYVQP